jgi:uncharacterized protein
MRAGAKQLSAAFERAGGAPAAANALGNAGRGATKPSRGRSSRNPLRSGRPAISRNSSPRDRVSIRGGRQGRPDTTAHRLHLISTFVFRLKAPRPTFALDMTDEEREIMGRHAGHWQPFIDSGQMVIFGPVLDSTGSWGLGVIEAEDEEELRAFAAGDPAVTTGTAKIELGKMLDGFVRPR